MSVLGGTIAGVSNDDDVDVYVSELEGGSEMGAVVSTTRIKAGDLDEASVGKLLGFHDDKTQRNVSARILRVEHHDGPPPAVSVWFRYIAPEGRLDLPSLDDYMRVAPGFELQLVEMVRF
jgi:hypothetical protein